MVLLEHVSKCCCKFPRIMIPSTTGINELIIKTVKSIGSLLDMKSISKHSVLNEMSCTRD